MSDITGPPAPKELQPSVRGADKASQVAKDQNNTDARTQDRQQSDSGSGQSNTNRTRDPAVSISATAAHVRVGEQLTTSVSSVDSEGRPVIITDKATYALKPDAGLQVDDDVVLKITEAAKSILADLQARNSYPLDPPIRLELIITEIHAQQTNQANPATGENARDGITSQPYRPPLAAQVKTETIIPGTTPVRPEVSVLGQQPSNETNTQQRVTNNTNLASTFANQATEKQTVALSPQTGLTPASAALNSQQPVSTAQILPANAQATGNVHGASNGPGVGPAITAVSSSGQPSIIQVLDPAISKVSPSELATVTQVSPLTPAHAVALDSASGALINNAFDTAAALSVVETNRGSYIAETKGVSDLTGELVRVANTGLTSNASAQTTLSPTTTTSASFPALLISAEDGVHPQKVSVSFIKANANPESASKIQTATVNSVTTQAAFLSPTGPKTDIRLQTTAGDVSLTIPSADRPVVGDTLHIRWPDTSIASGQTPTTAATLEPTAIAETVSPQATTPISAANMLANWPAMQESVAAIAASGNTAAVQAMQDKTAQTGGKLTNSLLFFLAAAGRVGPKAWIGEQASQNLQNNAPSLLRQLSSDISQMANMTTERSGDWRAFMLPFEARSENVPLAALLVQQNPEIDPDGKGQGKDQNQNNEGENQRFILQVQFSVLGDIQLDGRINKQQFDLTVRSASAFNKQLQTDLTSLFSQSLAANDYAGGLRFEEQHPFSVDAAAVIEEKLMGSASS